LTNPSPAWYPVSEPKGVDFMFSVVSAIRNTVPITQFNRGLAGQIFEDVKATGAKVVMKNNSAECVLLAPDEYLRIMDELNDARLAALAAERVLRLDPSTLIPEEKVWDRLGITDDDLTMTPEVEFE
jgi:PHD/YefM family antitoxin component YafN of YafNO toxin-antitoxin module